MAFVVAERIVGDAPTDPRLARFSVLEQLIQPDASVAATRVRITSKRRASGSCSRRLGHLDVDSSCSRRFRAGQVFRHVVAPSRPT